MNLVKTITLSASVAALLLVSACARNMQGDVYSSSSSVGKVVYGTVVSVRQVTIKDNEDPNNNGLGAIAGGVAGGVGGSEIGKGKGSVIGAIGGALAGAMIGAVAEDQLSTTSGYEYIVELDSNKSSTNKIKRSATDLNVNRGNSVESDVMNAAIPEENATGAISVIQQDDQPIAEGSRVMVVYRDDRARIVPSRR
jgi:outer membrane lipoprotein SlyB